MTTLVLSVDGVLAHTPEGANLLHYESAPEGRILYDTLKHTSRVILLCSDSYEERVVSWLIRERFSKYAGLYCYPLDSGLTPEEWKVAKILDLIGIGHSLAFFVSANPATVQQALDVGVSSMLVAYSSVIPGKSQHIKDSYPSWDTLVESIEDHAMRKSIVLAAKGDGDD